jgi:hypothetical protein
MEVEHMWGRGKESGEEGESYEKHAINNYFRRSG